MQVGCVVGQEILLPLGSAILADLLKNLCAETAAGILTKNGRIVKGKQTIACSLVRRLHGLLRFAVNNTDGHRVEVSSHAVQAKAEQSEILLAPVECTVQMTLNLACAVHSAGHVVHQMTRRNAHKSDAILELMPNANRLMLIHMKRIGGIVVPLE